MLAGRKKEKKTTFLKKNVKKVVLAREKRGARVGGKNCSTTELQILNEFTCDFLRNKIQLSMYSDWIETNKFCVHEKYNKYENIEEHQSIMRIELIPLDRVIIDGKSICLGMKEEEAFSLLGKGEYLERYYFFDSELAIDFDSDNRVEFIEFLAGKDGNLEPVIYDCPVFEADAEEVLELLKEKNAGAIEDNENGYTYVFVNLQLGIYREATLEAVQRDIEDMKRDGIEDPEYIEEQLEKAKHWSTVGIGKKGYY